MGEDPGGIRLALGAMVNKVGTTRDHSVTAERHEGPPRPMRADALKNRQRILAAAEEVFADQGLSVPVDAVAEKAGLGVGTLYRHFPTKEALFEAIVVAKLDELTEAAERSSSQDDPGEAFFSLLELVARRAAEKHDLFDAMKAEGIDISSRCAGSVERLERRVDRLLQRAIAAGAVRDDVSIHEVIGLVVGASQVAKLPGGRQTSCQRMVQIVIDGLRPAAGR